MSIKDADTTALLEKLDKPVRDLKWRAYGNQHLSGWQGQGSMGGLWYITDTGPDGEGKDGWWCDGERFDTADEAQAAAQADYEQRILAALSLTPSDLEAIKAALVEREELLEALIRIRDGRPSMVNAATAHEQWSFANAVAGCALDRVALGKDAS